MGEAAKQEPTKAERQFRLWLEGALRSSPTTDWDAGYLTALRHALTEFDIAFRASSPVEPTV